MHLSNSDDRKLRSWRQAQSPLKEALKLSKYLNSSCSLKRSQIMYPQHIHFHEVHHFFSLVLLKCSADPRTLKHISKFPIHFEKHHYVLCFHSHKKKNVTLLQLLWRRIIIAIQAILNKAKDNVSFRSLTYNAEANPRDLQPFVGTVFGSSLQPQNCQHSTDRVTYGDITTATMLHRGQVAKQS